MQSSDMKRCSNGIGTASWKNKKENHPLRVVFFLGGASWTRTNDPIDVNDVLYRLSHGTKAWNRMYYITAMGLCQPLN